MTVPDVGPALDRAVMESLGFTVRAEDERFLDKTSGNFVPIPAWSTAERMVGTLIRLAAQRREWIIPDIAQHSDLVGWRYHVCVMQNGQCLATAEGHTRALAVSRAIAQAGQASQEAT
jgi:hypothetical protein